VIAAALHNGRNTSFGPPSKLVNVNAIDLARLYASEQGRLKQFVRRLVGNRATAEDLVQDAFLNLLRGARTSEIEHTGFYLTRTARNLAIDHLRRDRKRSRYSREVNCSDILVCARPLPDAVLQGRQEVAVLQTVIDRLPPKCRRVFILSREHGLSMKEISERLHIAEKTVEKHIGRAMVDCRRELRAIGRDV
jgi:RNA polymerase sigma-70 factor (family 1)